MPALSNTPILTAAEIGALASNLDALHTRTLKVIARLNQDVAERKRQIAERWKAAPGLSAGDLARFAEQETLASVRQIKDNAEAELDKLIKDAGAPHAQLIDQRQFYDSPAKVLSRAALGDPKRTDYLQQLQHAGPAELASMAQLAVSTQNVPLAAAVLSLLDRMPTKDRPHGPAEFALAMRMPEYAQVTEWIKLGDLRLQGILVSIRAFRSGKSNPLNTVALGLREKAIDHSVIGDD